MAAVAVGITVEAVREQLAQLGHFDVSEEVIADFLAQLAAEGGCVPAADHDDDDDRSEGEVGHEDRRGGVAHSLDKAAYIAHDSEEADACTVGRRGTASLAESPSPSPSPGAHHASKRTAHATPVQTPSPQTLSPTPTPSPKP
jgi:hypothetical protein